MPQVVPDADVIEFIQKLLARGANVNARLAAKIPFRGSSDATWISEAGGTPFYRAAYSNDIAVMRMLLDHGADPNINATDGTIPLMAAAGVGYQPGFVFTCNENLVESLKMCLDLGNDINAVNNGKPNSGGPSGVAALHGAAFKGVPEGIQFLVDHGANLYQKDTGEGAVGELAKGRIPLNWAEGGSFETQPPQRQEQAVQLILKLMAAHPKSQPSEEASLKKNRKYGNSNG